MLSKAWKHPQFAQLKSKWMYISFSDTNEERLGGAAQGIIPIQDAEGNLLGGGAPASPEIRQVRKEAKEVKNEMGKLEDRFDQMLKAVECNTAQVVSLLERNEKENGGKHGVGDDFNLSELSSHLGRINDLLARNSEHVESLAQKQQENEKQLRAELKEFNSKKRNDPLNMSQLSSHLHRIQNLMEQNLSDRKDSGKELAEPQQPMQVDFSPLTERLGKVQEAVEQNSALIKALLDEGTADSKAGTPFWGKDSPAGLKQTPQPPDLSPLTEHLEKIHTAIEQQSNHMQALVGFASGGDDDAGTANTGGSGSGGGDTAERSLAPLSEHLEQIYNAIEEGNKHARSQQALQIDLKPLLEAQNATRLAVEAGNKVDMGPLVAMFDGLIEHMRSVRENGQSVDGHLQLLIRKQNELHDTFAEGAGKGQVDFAPLGGKLDSINEHLENLREWSEFNAERWQEFVDARAAEKEERQAATQSPNTEIDLTPLTERLNRIHASLEKQAFERDERPGAGDPKFLMSALTSHLSRIQAVTESNAQHITRLTSSHAGTRDKMHVAVSETSDQVRALSAHVGRQDDRIEGMSGQVRELMSGQREMVEAMRELARSIKSEKGGSCDHVVVPPPRKMGRKIVGFVYDGKEGAS